MAISKSTIIRIITLMFFVFSFVESFGQGKISRPNNKPQRNHQQSQRTPQNNSTDNGTDIIESPLLPNMSETINGITVRWNGVTQKQKDLITNLINRMTYIEGGSFMMGSNEYYKEETPVHKEYVSSFYLDKFELTQDLWNLLTNFWTNRYMKFKGDNEVILTF